MVLEQTVMEYSTMVPLSLTRWFRFRVKKESNLFKSKLFLLKLTVKL